VTQQETTSQAKASSESASSLSSLEQKLRCLHSDSHRPGLEWPPLPDGGNSVVLEGEEEPVILDEQMHASASSRTAYDAR